MDKERGKSPSPEERFDKAHRGIMGLFQERYIRNEQPAIVIAQGRDQRRLTIESSGIWNVEDASGERTASFMGWDLSTSIQVYGYYSDREFRKLYTECESGKQPWDTIKQLLAKNSDEYRDGLIQVMENALSQYSQGHPQTT